MGPGAGSRLFSRRASMPSWVHRSIASNYCLEYKATQDPHQIVGEKSAVQNTTRDSTLSHRSAISPSAKRWGKEAGPRAEAPPSKDSHQSR
jgi:hypothetical protein